MKLVPWVTGSNRIPGRLETTASATKTLPNTMSEVSAMLKLSQLSTFKGDTLH